MWDKVLPWFENRYRVVRFDARGHGKSGAPSGQYTLEDLRRDVLFLLDHLGIERADFCGLSLGGLVAMSLGIHAPQRVRRLVLANTGARIGTREMWDERIATVKRSGMAPLARTTLTRWFTDDYREQHEEEMEIIQAMVVETDPGGYTGCCGVLRDSDLRGEIAGISVPCLVITGKHDPATPPSDGQAVHRALQKSKYVELEASHLSAWERAAEFGAEIVEFLEPREVRNG
jgi:3-oxoadipate enol-lactonase